MTLFTRDFQIFLFIILWGPCDSGDKSWTNWKKAPLGQWQMQLNFAMWCASSACGISSEQHPMPYRFHVYYHVRRILKRLQVPSGNMKLVLRLLAILFPMLKYVSIIEFLTILSNITAQKAFLNNSENVVNRRVDIREDIKHYQETLSYGSITEWEKIFTCSLVSQLNKCLKFITFWGLFCIEYSHFYPPEWAWILNTYPVVTLW